MAMNDYFIPKCSDYIVHDWRKERFWNEEVDNFLKAHLPLLHDVYDSYRGNNRKPGEDKFMKSDEFERIWIDCRLIMDLFTQRDVVLQFTNSVQTQVDELEQDRHLKAIFIEFLEAFARSCDRISYSPLLLSEEQQQQQESARETMKVSARKSQGLVTKMENVMHLVFQCCTRTFKLKYQFPEKDPETGLYFISPQAEPFIAYYAGNPKCRRKNIFTPKREGTPKR